MASEFRAVTPDPTQARSPSVPCVIVFAIKTRRAALTCSLRRSHTSPTGRPVPARLIDVNRIRSHTPYVAMGRSQRLLPPSHDWRQRHSLSFSLSFSPLLLSLLTTRCWWVDRCAAVDLGVFFARGRNSIVLLDSRLRARPHDVSSRGTAPTAECFRIS